MQWRIQNFPEKGSQLQRRRRQLIFTDFPQKLYENEKKLDPEGRLWYPLGSANATVKGGKLFIKRAVANLGHVSPRYR